MTQALGLMVVGLAVGVFGTLIGAGGGFLLVPVLLALYPQELPKTITSISLAVVFLNALSGSIAYARMKRIDYRSGALFASATVPGAIGGVLATGLLSRELFSRLLGVLLVAISGLLFWLPLPEALLEEPISGRMSRVLQDAQGQEFKYAFDERVGIGLSFGVGLFSSLMGIGGGVIHVPALIHLLHFPPHVATATSHFILAIMALVGSLVHWVTGEYSTGYMRTLYLGAGVLAGAQVGARLSSLVQGGLLVKLLAVALALLGVRLLLMPL